MNKSDLEKLVELRISEAACLLKAKHFPGAYYLSGYALECAIKACIAKQVRQHDFPNQALTTASHKHKLQELISAAGLIQELNYKERADTEFKLNWAVAKDWSVETRYDHDIKETRANDLYNAITDKSSGVLAWLKTYW